MEQFLERLLSGTCAADARIFQRIEASNVCSNDGHGALGFVVGIRSTFRNGMEFFHGEKHRSLGAKGFSCSYV